MKRPTRHALLGVGLSAVLATGVLAQQDFSKVQIKTRARLERRHRRPVCPASHTTHR